MKKNKFIAFIVLFSMMLNCIYMAVPSRAELIDPAPSTDATPFEFLLTYAMVSAGRLDADGLNEWYESRCYNIKQARENGQKVELLDESTDHTYISALTDNSLDIMDAFYYLVPLSMAIQADSYADFYEYIRNQKIFNDAKDFELIIKFTARKDGIGGYNTKSGDVIELSFTDTTSESIVDYFDVESKIGTGLSGTEKEIAIYNELEKAFGSTKTVDDGRSTEGGYISIFTKDLIGYPNSDSNSVIKDPENASDESLISNFEVSMIADGKTYYYVFGYDSDILVNSSGTVGAGSMYAFNSYIVSSFDELEPEDSDDLEFSTELEYEAYIAEKEVGGTISDGTFLPNYDENNIKEDADVTAIINSTTDEDIVQVNGKDLNADGTPNDDGWYYINPDDKKQIAKQYKFDDYDNSTDNGKVSENVTLTSSEGNTDEQTVSIKWPFRIIDVTYDPENPTDEDDEVTVTIETNLPMDPNKIPDGWTIVPDTDNHKITKTYKKGEDIDETVTVYQNGSDDSDDTNVNYEWPSDDGKKDDTTSPKLPDTGETFTILVIIGVLVATAIISKKKFKSKK